MRKIVLRTLLLLPATAMLISCDKSEDPIPDGEIIADPKPDEELALDLSKDEMANCYIVTSPGKYMFKADNQFNLGVGLPIPPEINPDSAALVWQSMKNSVKSVELVKNENGIPFIVFEINEANGNAVIAAIENGEIVWSWHIWMPDVEIVSIPSSTGYEVMNLNLGALNDTPGDASSYGMLYQWGRKDPFPASATLTGTVETLSAPVYDIDNNPVTFSNSSWYNTNSNTLKYSIGNPTVVLSNYSQYFTSRDWLASEYSDDSLWGNPEGKEVRKTCYDPSPAGWRIASPDTFHDFTASSGYSWNFSDFNVADINNDGVVDLNDYNYGWHFMINDTTPLYFPAASRFDGSYAMLMGSMSGLWGNYWSNAPSNDDGTAGRAFCCLSFQTKGQNGEDWVTVSPSGAASRADAYSIRCVRDN